jgi:alkanesulfonate monooxygenase SsuD/methylene tetrahydromethanopterin reductase-like flavin-dependent oxidoreductase (luciferase family)
VRIGTSLRFLFPAGPQTTEIYQALAAASPPGAFIDRPMGSDDVAEQAANLLELARAASRSHLWGLLVGDNHSIPPQYANLFQPVPTIARLSAETGTLTIGMVLLAPFYHPLLLAEQIGTLSAFVDAPLVVTFASGGHDGAFNAFGYTKRSRGVRTEEVVPAIRSLRTGQTVTASGRSFELANATISPVPRHPVDLWIAGTNEITTERAGRLGDGWLTAQNATDDELVELLDLYRRTAEAHDRQVLPVLRRDIHVAETDEQARAHVDPILEAGYRGVGYDRLLVGSPDTVVARLRHYEALGFEHVMVRHITGDHAAMLTSFELLGDVVEAVTPPRTRRDT